MSQEEEIEEDKEKNKPTSILKNIKINRISLNDYTLLETIGTGSYGRVKLCRNKKTNKIYAIKRLKKEEIIRMKQVDHLFSEYSILAIIYHPFIVELKGVNFTEKKYLYFLLDFVPGGELFSLLRTNGTFPIEQARFYSAHIVTIFDYLHNKNIVYRDLKPENILINTNGYLKLTDFGFAKIITNNLTYTLCGTPEYLAPEIITNKGHGKGVDWWTFGVLLYEMTVGIDPFNDTDPMQIYQKILKGKVKYPKGMNKDVKSLIKHLLVIEITRRYGCLREGVKDIIDHKFFADFDWKGLLFKTLTPPYIPKVRNMSDTSNFNAFPDDSDDDDNYDDAGIRHDKDPFFNW